MGFQVLDADSLGHKVIERGQAAYEEVVQEFGASLTDDSGRIDRRKLGALVFADREKLDRLNAIVHPRVEKEVFRQFSEWERNGVHDAVFVEAALLVEAGYQKNLDGLVVTWCTPEQQVARLKARGLSEEEAQRRIGAQMPVEEKLKFATEKIDCSGTIAETKRQVEALAAKLRKR
jgi:dephospho-CoA kinase